MKKILLLALLLPFYFLSVAQITINSSDMPSSGDIYIMSNTQDYWSIDVSQTGANHTWDFSFLTPDFQESDTFVSVSSTPFAYQFFFNNIILYSDHFSDYAIKGFSPPGGGPVSIDKTYEYFKKTNSALIQTGIGAEVNSVPSSIQYDPRDFIYRFPMDYGNVDSNTAFYLATVPTLGAYGQTIDRRNEVDGWGTLITPMGTFSALRVKTTVSTLDTIYIDQLGFGTTFSFPPRTEYKWIGLNSGLPLVTITEGVSGGPNPSPGGIVYQDTLQPVGLENSLVQQTKVYPSPAHGRVVIEFAGNIDPTATPMLYNLQGERFQAEYHLEENKIVLERGKLAAGMYFLAIRDSKGNPNIERIVFQ